MATSYRHSSKNSDVDASLLSGTKVPRNYGSFADDIDEAIALKNTRRTLGKMSGVEGDEALGYRCLAARSVRLPPQKWYRRVRIPGLIGNTSPHSNAVKTTKYTVLNFIFKNLWEQFHRFANIYFLFIALLNFVPAVEAFGKEVGFVPLASILLVTAVKDIFEDYRRFRSDREVNGRICRVYDWETSQYREKLWQDVRVGDFIQLACDEAIPADMLLLHSSDPNDICYIETANIDGETNLKQRQVAPGSVSSSGRREGFSPGSFTRELHCEEPHNIIYEFNAFIQREDGGRVGVNRSSLLLRGCVLRNTTQVVGIVVYAGHQTKALLNNSGPRAKRSKLERDINVDILSQGFILLTLSVLGAIVNGVWTARNLDANIPFFPFSSRDVRPALEGFTRFWTFIILYQVIIPVSLYVTLEIVKFIQVYLINWDRAMYYEPTDQPFQCRALNINEDLGQIQYVFSDKTGTLTENEMVFRCCSIGGLNYPHNLRGQFDKYGTSGADLSLLTPYLAEEEQTDFPLAPTQQVLSDPLLCEAAKRDDDMIRDFFLVMAICNTVVVSATGHRHSASEGGEGGEGGGAEGVVYEAESPDEAALVEAARSYGYTLISRSPGQCSILTPSGEKVEFEVLQVLEFDPNRKCMSVIVREKDSSKILLLSKGADSVIYSNLAHPSGTLPRGFQTPRHAMEEEKQGDPTTYSSQHSDPNNRHPNCVPPGLAEIDRENGPQQSTLAEQELLSNLVTFAEVDQEEPGGGSLNVFSQAGAGEIESGGVAAVGRGELTQQHLDMYARFGLRTLCMARRELKEEEYATWLQQRKEVEVSLSNRDQQLFQSSCSIEQNLELLGATGIEDRLQEGVPEAIKSLRGAGLKVWVLTGDKQETAINIGYSSHLIDQDMDIIILNAHSLEETRALLEERRAEFERQGVKVIGEQQNGSSDSSDSVVVQSPLLKFSFLRQCEGAGDDYRGVPKALVINGTTLHFALDPSIKKLFLDVAKRCRSVICCRAAPLQKAAVVMLVKQQLCQMTLAVGDGANDVSMIHKADVGVGIAGREGMQAVMASDFAMARFRFIVRLLLVHGHWCYSRLARLMLYFFFKNVAYAMVIFWFQLFNAFSGSNLIDGINLFTYNLLFTSVPVIVVAVGDQDLKAEVLLEGKVFYEQGRCSKVYTRWKFWLTILDAFYESAVVFFVAYGAYYRTDVGIAEFGFVVNMTIVIVASFHLAVETLHWTGVHHLALWGSVAFAFLFNYVYCAIDSQQRFIDTLWVMQQTSARAEFWFTMLLSTVLALFPRILAKVLEQEFFPSPVLAARATESLLRRRGRGRRRRGERGGGGGGGGGGAYTANAGGNESLPQSRVGNGGRGGASLDPDTSNHHTETEQRMYCRPL